MAVLVTCPGCRAPLRFADPLPGGAVARCPKCQGVVPLPPADTSLVQSEPTADRTVAAPPTGVFAAPAAPPAEPTVLGHYRILETLGVGGMGRVYRADDPVLHRQVAVKVMLPHHAADPAAKARFLREARAQARVEHDHIVTIHQVGEEDGVPFIAMPLLRGTTLADALAAGPRPPLAEVVRVGREAAEGLAAAHESGLVHRDIKPSNVWLEGQRRRVKILDFGLARVGGAADAHPADPNATLLDAGATAQGTVVGTPLYMSPEQARGGAVDFRTDLFSLGVVLYQMATGTLPFGGPSTTDVLAAVETHDPPTARDVDPAVPAALSDLIARLMAKTPADRPASAAAVAEELARLAPHDSGPTADDTWTQITEDESDAAPPVRAARRRTRPVVVVGLSAGLLALFLGTAVLIRALSPVGTLAVEGEEAELVVRRDGAEVARTRDRSIRLPAGDGYTVELADPKPDQRVEPAKVSLADGGRVGVRVVTVTRPKPAPRPTPTLTGEPEPLARIPKTDGWIALSPDGATLAVPVAGQNEVWLLDTRTGEPRHKLGGFRERPFRSAFSPDGTLVATACPDATVGVWAVKTGELVRRLDHDGGALAVAFDPKGKYLAAAGMTATRAWELDSWGVRFTARGHIGHAHGLAASPDGTTLAVGTTAGIVRLLDAADGTLKKFLVVRDGDSGVAFSPDGTRLAGGGDRVLQVWEVPSGKELFRRDVAAAWQQFSADGKDLWVGPWNTSPPPGYPPTVVHRWGAAGDDLGILAGPALTGYASFAVSRDGTTLYAATQLEIWACDPRAGRVLPRPAPRP